MQTGRCALILDFLDRHLTEFALSAMILLLPIGAFGQLQSPAGAPSIDHSPVHIGIDLNSTVGEPIRSPIRGRIAYIVNDRLGSSQWQGVVIEGLGNDFRFTTRILGAAVAGDWVGKQVRRNDVIGQAIDAAKAFGYVRQHIHVELYRDKKLVDPTAFYAERWASKHIIDAGTHYVNRQYQEFQRAMDRGLENTRDAINLLKNALKITVWESFDFEPYLHLADKYAEVGDFSNAVIVQKQLVDLLELERKCAAGDMPGRALGIVSACRTELSLDLLIVHMKENLAAYQANMPTVIYY